MPLELFMTALPAQGVTLDKTPDGKATLRGLPVLRPGTWNGRSYTADDLAALAANFAEIRDGDRWTPTLRPRHMLDASGNPVSLDARETLAWHNGLTWDATAGVLTADLEVVDARTVADLESGKLRYVSAEVVRSGYTSPVTGKVFDTPVYYGAAFVDNPAVKGMPWALVTNAAEFRPAALEQFASWAGLSADQVRAAVASALKLDAEPDSGWVRDVYEDAAIVERAGVTERVPFKVDKAGALTVGKPVVVRQQWVPVEALESTGRTPAENKDGDSKMGWLDSLKNVLRKEGATEAELAAVDQLAAAPPAPPQAPDPPAPVAPPVADGTRAQMEQLMKTVGEQTALIEQLRQTRVQEAAQATVDKLVGEGIVPPALRVQCLALVSALSTDESQIEVLAADAEGKPATRKVRALELLQELLAGMKPRLASPPALAWVGPETLGEATPVSEDALDRMAAAAGGTPKGGKS